MIGTRTERDARARGRLARPLLGVLLLAGTFLAGGLAAKADDAKLGKTLPYTVGDDVATRMSAIFRTTAGLPQATLVFYDRKDGDIVVHILGSTDDPVGARREIEGFVDAIATGVAPYAKGRHGVPLTERDVTFIYFNETGDEPPYEVVRRHNGDYVVPGPPAVDGTE
ncbi:MAG TPA: hypothetical protein VLT84_08295 [Acidobacteriota bacterium]|nr:hypothetical protein [Acidobacteriota bacterium]